MGSVVLHGWVLGVLKLVLLKICRFYHMLVCWGSVILPEHMNIRLLNGALLPCSIGAGCLFFSGFCALILGMPSLPTQQFAWSLERGSEYWILVKLKSY